MADNRQIYIRLNGGKLEFVKTAISAFTELSVSRGVSHHMSAAHDDCGIRLYVDGVSL